MLKLRVRIEENRRGSRRRLDILNISEETLPLIKKIIDQKSGRKMSDKRVQTEGLDGSGGKKELKLPFLKWKIEKSLG